MSDYLPRYLFYFLFLRGEGERGRRYGEGAESEAVRETTSAVSLPLPFALTSAVFLLSSFHFFLDWPPFWEGINFFLAILPFGVFQPKSCQLMNIASYYDAYISNISGLFGMSFPYAGTETISPLSFSLSLPLSSCLFNFYNTFFLFGDHFLADQV